VCEGLVNCCHVTHRLTGRVIPVSPGTSCFPVILKISQKVCGHWLKCLKAFHIRATINFLEMFLVAHHISAVSPAVQEVDR
jgi:hypothetical protein